MTFQTIAAKRPKLSLFIGRNPISPQHSFTTAAAPAGTLSAPELRRIVSELIG
jgi:hypothetical protein